MLNVSKTGELFVKKIESILWSTFLIFNFNLSIKFFNSMISPLSNALTDAGLVIPNDAKPELKFILFYLSLWIHLYKNILLNLLFFIVAIDVRLCTYYLL